MADSGPEPDPVARSNTIDGLVSALRMYETDATVCTAALRALHNAVAGSAHYKDVAAAAGAAGVALTVAFQHTNTPASEQINEDAVQLLWALSSGGPSARSAVRLAGAHAACGAALDGGAHCGHAPAVLAALGCLRNLSGESRSGTQSVVDAGVTEAALAAVTRHQDSGAVVGTAVLLLARLCDDVQGAVRGAAVGGCEALGSAVIHALSSRDGIAPAAAVAACRRACFPASVSLSRSSYALVTLQRRSSDYRQALDRLSIGSRSGGHLRRPLPDGPALYRLSIGLDVSRSVSTGLERSR